MDLTGAQVGVFEVWGPIGEGGMSRVWLARHRELSVPVVLKTLRETEESREAFERLRNEARLMARVPSSVIVRAVDAGMHRGAPYIAQEYVDGLDLAELDRRRRAAVGSGLPLWFVCDAAAQVADALHSAHKTGVLHRDVKPSNLLGSPQMGVRLGDFGIAQARGLEETKLYGTLRFIAPEALRGEPPTRQCDVYSLGSTAYDLRYGEAPFSDLVQILGDAPAVFPPARSAEEAYFQHVLGRMLHRDPAKRYGSMALPRRLFAYLARQLRPALPAIRVERGAWQVGPVRVSCTLGDIAEAQADGIVNSANDEMRMAVGVGAALRKRGGQVIEDEATKDGRRALGDCVATSGGSLACRYVLHAVSAWNQASCVARTSQRVFLLAEELGLRSLAIPALGTGQARVAPEASAYAVGSALYEHVLLGGSRIREVRFVLYDTVTRELFIDLLEELFLGEVDPTADASDGARDDPAGEETVLLPFSSRRSSF